jgi:hypothetical protein
MPKCHTGCGEWGVAKFRKKWLCRECLCAEQVPIQIPILRSSSGWMISNETSNGFNTAEFSKEVTQAMRRIGMKFTRWQGLEKKDGSLDKKTS